MRTIIIDGYNVLLGIGMLKRPPVGAELPRGELQKARQRFLSSLTGALPKSIRRQIVIVFDSAMRLPELPDKYVHESMEVYFASGHTDADEMIIQWLKSHSSPKQVLVVSSDHEIQTAASRRKAKFQDAIPWFEQTIENPAPETTDQQNVSDEKNEPINVDVNEFLDMADQAASLDFSGRTAGVHAADPDSPEEVEKWLDDFDQQFQEELKGKFQNEKASKDTFANDPLSDENAENVEESENVENQKENLLENQEDHEIEQQLAEETLADKIEDVDESQIKKWNRQLDQHTPNPFPPGYGEDLLLGQPLPSNDPRDRWERKKKK